LIHKIAQVGLDIKHDVAIELVIKRALKEGLLSAKGEFIAILMLILYLKRLAL
jgi:hypothetical protein